MTNVHKKFNDFVVLNNITLTVNRGEILAVIGSSGSGKSTLLRSLIKLVEIDSGNILIDKSFLARTINGKVEYASSDILRSIRLQFGMIFQNFPLFPHLTVLENITLAPIKVLRMGKEQVIFEAQELLKKVGLEEFGDAYPFVLSGGQKQRAAIARALAMKPDIMLFDEPTSALDPELAAGVLKIIRNLASQGEKTIIMVTHQLKFVEKIADRVIFIDTGTVAEQGPPKELFADPKTTRLKDFLSHK